MKPKFVILFKQGRTIKWYGQGWDMGEYLIIRTPFSEGMKALHCE